ncbi:MAG TPA: hypothetical protein VEL51_15640 [Vicinamibacterales bacterium]|nr:hypothetical protein [Vicinamibacterales bacterium]
MERNTTENRSKAVWGARIALAAFVVLTLLAAASCSQAIRTGQSPGYLVINTLEGAQGTGEFGSTLESDVISDSGAIVADRGQASLQLVMKDPLASPSPANAITIDQYHVEYIRSDGRNAQGIDVPYAFDSAVTATVSGSASVPFTLVRIQAKQEAPLAALARGGGARAITTIARVTFYGHDQNGREVSVTGNIEVTFADWVG